MLWNTLNLFFSSTRNDGHSAFRETGPNSDFPRGHLTSAPWEGWWDNAAQV